MQSAKSISHLSQCNNYPACSSLAPKLSLIYQLVHPTQRSDFAIFPGEFFFLVVMSCFVFSSFLEQQISEDCLTASTSSTPYG